LEYGSEYSEQEVEKVLKKLISKKTKLIGFSTTWWTALSDKKYLDIMHMFKKHAQKINADIKFVVGGARVSSKYPFGNGFEESAKVNDFYVSSFAEEAFIHILDYLSKKVPFCRGEKYEEFEEKYFLSDKIFKFETKNLRTVWLPEDNIKSYQGVPIEISRGCIFNCSFCQFPLRGKTKFDYFRRAEELYEEFTYNYENFGITRYVFVDDTYNDSREKIDMMSEVISKLNFDIEFGSYIKPELLVSFPEHQKQLIDQGLRFSSLGIESFNEESRKVYKKGKNLESILEALENMWKYSVSVDKEIEHQFLMIIGGPGDTVESVLESYEYIKNAKYIVSVHYTVLGLVYGENNLSTDPSSIETNPEKYGYKVYPPQKDGFSLCWESKYMDRQMANKLYKNIIADQNNWNRPSGFTYFVMFAKMLSESSFNEMYKNKDYNFKDFILSADLEWSKKAKNQEIEVIMNDVRTPINVERYVEPQPIKFV